VSTNFQLKCPTCAETEQMELSVYNAIGQLVAVVDRGIRSGYQCLRWAPEDMQGRRLASGIYFLQLKTDDTFEVKKMVIVE
jgi:hypothetical protein